MEKHNKLILSILRRAYSISSDSGDSDSDQDGQGVATRASARLAQRQPVQTVVHNPSPEQVLPQESESASEPEPAQVIQPEPDSAKILFQDEPTVFANNEIKLYVIRDYLKRQKIFRLDDHLYQLKAEILKGRAPLISSVLDALKQALEFIVTSLQTSYHAGKAKILKRHKYICFSFISTHFN